MEGRFLRALSVLCFIAVAVCTFGNAGTASPKPNDLLGKWIGLTEGAGNLDFRSDGTVIITIGGKTETMFYRQELEADWWKRRLPAMKASGAQVDKDPFAAPGMQVVSISNKKELLTDIRSMPIFFDSVRNYLTVPMSAVYCRPGDETRVKELSGIAERERNLKSFRKRVAAWRPKIDVSSKWKVEWSTKMSGTDPQWTSLAADGQSIFVPETNGVSIITNRKRKFLPIPHKAAKFVGPFVTLGKSRGSLRLAIFGTWGQSLDVYDSSGKRVWRYDTSGHGIDWVTPVKIDDLNTGFAISYNGDYGVELLNADGKQVWRAKNGANGWNVCSGKLTSSGKTFVIATASNGAQAYDLAGKKFRFYGPADAGAVFAADLDGDAMDEVMVLRTTGDYERDRLTVFNSNGKRLWSSGSSGSGVALVEGQPMFVGTFGGKRMLAIADGTAIRFLNRKGKVVGDWKFRDTVEAVAIMHDKHGDDLLLVRLDTELRCYRFIG